MENEEVKVVDQPKTEEKQAEKVEEKKVEAPAKAVPETKFDFAKTTFEYDGKKFTAESINAKVLEYLNKHPYISAKVIETFVNIGEKRIYFTVDGFGNGDFTIDL